MFQSHDINHVTILSTYLHTHAHTHAYTHNLSRLTINIDGWVSRISLPWQDAFCISSSYVYYDKGQSK